MAERQFGPYRLVRQIAVGGMAEIHLAKTKGIAGFEKYVALKMIHPNFAEDDQFIQMLVDEAKIAVQLNHGNIAQTFDLGRVGETFYITMEYVDGADLYKILRRGSEQDLEMPLDICAFVMKEVASALDHAHRKRDHGGKSLGIVHRDVSPQNVLISYAGEVKLVDFGIAKATMKARQTAVGVIKGKYYYMSPEQARGDSIDFRSDIFSAGIVLYEMITGQMLYLEEDLHKLLDMARRAEIDLPSTLRKGIPPQLERIVMRALAKVPGERYQSAGDMATDLERFLHGYAPVFTAGKIAALMRKVIGDPVAVPAQEVEARDGPTATHTLDPDDLIHSGEELRDENSMIFSLDNLSGRPAVPLAPPSGPRVTRQAALEDLAPPAREQLPSITKPKPATPVAGTRAVARAQSRPRAASEMTREVVPAPATGDESGLLDVKAPAPSPWSDAAGSETDDELENIGERTMVTGRSARGFMIDAATEESVDATVVTGIPQRPADGRGAEGDDDGDDLDDQETLTGQRPQHDDEVATTTRDFRQQPRASRRGARPPPALAGKIHAPAVSELRKPRASRKTPTGGIPTPPPNVLQAMLGEPQREPMPEPRPPRDASPTQPPQPSQGYSPVQVVPAYESQHGYPPNYQQPWAGNPNYPQQPVSPGALYQLNPYGGPTPQPMSLTGQLRLWEADEVPAQYRVQGNARRWLKLVLAGALAIGVAAGATFFIIRATRDNTPATGTIRIDSVPGGGSMLLDGTHVTGVTPQTLPFDLEAGSRHEIRVELARHKPYIENVDIPKDGGEVAVNAVMDPITGRLRISTVPAGADIVIDGKLRGRTPTTINDIDLETAKKLELRLKDYSPYIQTLQWPANGEIDIDTKLAH
ncbi:hypothetical protein BH11MYX1_BH11MYX1_17130 [soil metagenome]